MKNQKGYTHWVVVILISAIAVGLVGAAWYYEDNKEEINANRNINKQSNECEANGGSLLSGSAEFGVRCIMPYADGGKVCYSSEECEGDCVTNVLSNLGKIGECDNSTYRSGCETAIEEDKLDCTMGDIRFGCTEDSWGDECYRSARKTPDSIECHKITTEEECNKFEECLGQYGPSYCDEDNCTADESYKDCDRNLKRDRCLFSDGTWKKSTEVGMSKIDVCVCPEGEELDKFNRCKTKISTGCSGLNEEECELNNDCISIVIAPECSEWGCDVPPMFQECKDKE